MKQNIEFKPPSDTAGLKPFQANLLVMRFNRAAVQGQFDGNRIVDFKSGDPIPDAHSYAVVEHPLMPMTPEF